MQQTPDSPGFVRVPINLKFKNLSFNKRSFQKIVAPTKTTPETTRQSCNKIKSIIMIVNARKDKITAIELERDFYSSETVKNQGFNPFSYLKKLHLPTPKIAEINSLIAKTR